ncbi:MAG: ABC transporter transmembrane domain-containing protein [Paracoccaceae bacterium]
MPRSLLAFVWTHSKVQQLWLLFLTFASFPFVYLSLEVPKIIVNEAIQGRGFPYEVAGVEIAQVPFLVLLCALFLALVVLINGFKWLLNVGIGMAGERLLRRLRFALFERTLRFPPARLRAQRPGETVQAIMGEIEPLGGFFGEVIATPVFQGGLLAVYVVFIFVQDLWLGLAAVSLYPVQAWLIPVLQREVVRLNRARASVARTLADRIGEGVAATPDIRTHATARWHLAQVAERLGAITEIRLALFKRKFTIKLINNFLNQLTPFFFYLIGGYLGIEGRLDFGALVAVLAAYKDLAGPWKAVLAFVQRWSDFSSRYANVVESVEVDGLMAPERLYGTGGPPLSGALVFTCVETGTPAGADALRVRDLRLAPGETVALTGGPSGARDAFLRLAAGLEPPEAGEIAIGGQPLAEASLERIGASIVYAGAQPAVLRASLRENALYGLLRRPPPPRADHAFLVREAALTGNPAFDPDGDWVDLDRAGVADTDALERRLIALADGVGLAGTLYSVALGRRLPAAQAERWGAALLDLRERMATRRAALDDVIEPWSRERYNENGSLLANLLFALPAAPGAAADPLAEPRVRRVLARSGGLALLGEVGWDIALELAALADALAPGSALFDRLAFSQSDVADAAAIVGRVGERGHGGLRRAEHDRLAGLAARFVVVRDRLDVLDEARRERVLSARGKALALVDDDPALIALDATRYQPARSVAENVLGAQRRLDRRSEWPHLDAALDAGVREAGLREDLLRIGLAAPATEAGLSAQATRRLGLLRALIKRPALVVLDGVADGESETDRNLRALIRAELPQAVILYAAQPSGAAADADRTVALDPSGALEAAA